MRGAPGFGRQTADCGRIRLVGWLLLVGCCVTVLVAASGAAAATGFQSTENATNETANATSDTSAPVLAGASKTNATAINVTLTDDSDIRTPAIAPATFELSTGRVRNVSVRNFTAVGGVNGTYVTLVLPERLNTDTVTVRLANGASVTDEYGNALTTGNVTVSGMDTRVPAYEAFTVDQLDPRTVEIRLVTNERLDGIRVAVTGPSSGTLAREDFEESVGRAVVYTAEYTFTEEGAHSIVWERATDRYDNTRYMSRMRRFYYEDDAPDIVLSAPETATVGESVAFSAAESTDEDGIDSYRWRIDGGTILTGESIDVAFASAGTHDIVLEVTDSDGNTAVRSRQVQVTTPAGVRSAVRVTRQNATDATARVDGTGFLQQVRARQGSLVAGANVSLERVDAAFPSNETVRLGLQARNGVPASFDGTGFGRFEIDHGGVAAENVTLRFAVNATALSRVGAELDDIALYRANGTWTPLSTTVVSEGEARVVLQASSPGLSRFVVGVSDDGANSSGTASVAGDDPPVATESPDARAGGTQQQTDASRPTATTDATPADTSSNTRTTESATIDDGGPLSMLPAPVAGILSGLPNPLSLWPDGIVGTVLAGFLGFVAAVYGILKALAIYLGY